MTTVWNQHHLCNQQIGGLTRILGTLPAHMTPSFQSCENKQAARCSSSSGYPARSRNCVAGEGSSSEGRRKQELLWRQFVQDPTVRWENRQHKTSSRWLDFRCRGSAEILWLDYKYKPAWVDEQLVAVDSQIGRGSPTPKSSLPEKPDSDRPAGQETGVTALTMSTLCQQGKVTEAVEALEVLTQTNSHISQSLFYTVLRQCVAKKDLALGRRVHAITVKMGYESDTFLSNHILRMYASYATLEEAMDVFTRVGTPDAFMWSSIISAHVKQGQAKQAIQLYHQMRNSSVKPDGHVFVAALQACARGADLETGQQVHADVLASGLEPGLFVVTCLVDMYAKCGSLKDAQSVFNRLPEKNVVTWNAMIAGYSQQGMGQEALDLYSRMKEEGNSAPDSVTFMRLLQACASVGSKGMETGKQLHAQIGKRGLEADLVVGCCLVNMYAKCGSLKDAQSVFDRLPEKDVVTWNAMIAGYSQQGMGQEALDLYNSMQEEGITAPTSVTFVCILQACASVGTTAMGKGKQLHALIGERGLEADVVVGNSLVNMYAKCGSLKAAQSVFDRLPEKDVVTWTAMITGYSQEGMGQEALHLYSAMQDDSITLPNSVTFVCLLQACASVGTTALGTGKQLHAQIGTRGLEADVVVGCSLVNMYAKCGSLEDARSVFDRLPEKNVVTWNALMAGYSQQGMGEKAFHLYNRMQKECIAAPDSVTFVCLLQACASVAALPVGKQLHAQIEERGLETDEVVGGSLVNMYAKCGSMIDAQRVFDALPERVMFAWNALIAGYTRQGDSEVVFDLVRRMTEERRQLDDITFLSVLTVCSYVGLVHKGREYFEAMSKNYGLIPSVEHYTCMVDLLGRAGQLDEALEVVRTMPAQPTDVIWHALLGACRKWRNVEVGRHAFDEAMKLNEKDAAAYVMMSNIYTGAQMWEEALEIQARRIKIGAWKQPGESWWTDPSGRVHSFSVGDKKHPESEGIYARLDQLVPK